MTPKQLASLVAEAADNTKAIDLITLDLAKLTSFTNYFVICSGRSDTQVRAIADNIVKAVKERGRDPLGLEGYNQGEWILIDFGDVVAHIFYAEVREHYHLEKLWIDAERTKISKRA